MRFVRTSVAPVADAANAPDLQPIRLYLQEMVLVASVSPGDERMTDILQAGGDLPILPGGAEARDPDAWLKIPIDDVLLVVPPRHVSAPEKRVQRQHHEVRFKVGSWVVEGTAHLKPGAELDAMLLSTQPFLPLTDVTIWAPDVAGSEERHEVAIVNLRQAEALFD